jgi:uncharacterized protein YjbI with pentapeptide repeats
VWEGSKSIDKLGIKEEFGKLFEGMDFSGCDFTGSGGGNEYAGGTYIIDYITSFKGCDLSNADFSGVKICAIRNYDPKDGFGIDFTGAKLDDLKLYSPNLG